MRGYYVVTLTVLLTPCAAHAGDASSAELRKVAGVVQAGWAALQKCMPSLQVDYEVRSNAAGRGTKLTFHAQYTWRTRGDDRYVVVARHVPTAPDDKPTQEEYVFAGNPFYQFNLARVPGAREWRLDKALPESNPATSQHNENYLPSTYVRDIARPWSHFRTPDSQPLHELFLSDTYSVENLAPSPVNPAWTRVQGTRPAKLGPNGKSEPKLVGWFDIDLQAGGCCRGMDVKRVYKAYTLGEQHTHAVQVGECGAVLLVKDVVTVTSEAGGRVKNDGYGEWSFLYKVDDRVPESEFTLAAFGLPEPPFASRRRSFLWLYLAVGALASGIAAWSVRRKVARGRNAGM